MRSLFLKLLGAFALVILIGAAADSFLVSRATHSQFNRFVTASGQAWARQIAPTLADYYARTGSWQGVETVLRSPWIHMMGMAQTAPSLENEGGTEPSLSGMMGPAMMEHGMGDMMMQNGQWTMGPDMMGDDMWAWMGFRLLLADDEGVLVADTASALTGTSLSPTELAAGTPIEADGRQIGTVLAISASADTASPASDFLRAVKRSTWLSSLTAGALALVLGLALFKQIVTPVRVVTRAAQRVAGGDLDQRVPIASQDEIGQLAVAFNQMADALERDRRLRRHMIADIAHELRTPLSVIQANLEAMLDEVLPPSAQEIASLHEETMLLSRLVADLRLLSLAEASQLKLEYSTIDLGEVVNRTLELLHPQAEANNVRLAVELVPPLPTIAADSHRIGQALSNLVNNALRYTPAGGCITLRVEAHTEADGSPSVMVQVSDTGDGIAVEDLPYVFDRFYRADPSRTRASGGSGIGLALVKQLVEAHGGRVWVESQAGQGTTFTFTLPVQPPTP